MSTAVIEREAPAFTSQNRFTIEADEPLDHKQKMKKKILEEHYQAEIAAALARKLAYVHTGRDKVTVGLQNAEGIDIGKLFDFGDRIEVSTGTDEQIAAALDLAKSKGWKTMKFQGTPEFKKRASQMAADAGFEIKGYKPTPKPLSAPATLFDELSVMVADAPKLAAADVPNSQMPAPHVLKRLAAHQRIQEALDGLQGTQSTPSVSEPLPVVSGDPYMEMCRSERQRVKGEIESVRTDLAKVKTHDIAMVRRDALAVAQNDQQNAHIMESVRIMYADQLMLTQQLLAKRERHAKRGQLGKILATIVTGGELGNLAREVKQSKSLYIKATRIAKQKLLETDSVRYPISWAQADNERHAKLTQELANLEREAQNLLAFEGRLEQSGIEGKKHLQFLQRCRALDPTEQRIHDLVRRHEQVQRLAAQIVEDKAKMERQLDLAKQRELEESTEMQHEVPRPR